MSPGYSPYSLPSDSPTSPEKEKYNTLACYVNDFETTFLNDTAYYYARKASNLTKEEYAVKADECLQNEKDRASRYLHPSTKEKLLITTRDVLYALLKKILEK
ncbi:hypothetical protein MKW98_001523 [Papaver atlanticum]|uniref:Cullin N-terminal domain-containing protein n=1 Tax=Papaver atlanticum TaxID=357466 RepID=A0AAD4XB31_9MAGN|nr:hypothetical protein MKW98_001523 [Papaver atlanticum]